MSSKPGGRDDDGGVLWDPSVCVLEQSVSFRLFGRLEDGRRAAPKELRSVRPLRVGQPIQSLDELIVELYEHFLPCHDHMVDHMVMTTRLGVQDRLSLPGSRDRGVRADRERMLGPTDSNGIVYRSRCQ